MTPREDAYGEAIRAHHAGEKSFEMVERNDGSVGPPGDPKLYFSRSDEQAPRERVAIGRAEGRVLDVGCGAGRHALYLQERGHKVVRIDTSPGAVAVSRDRGVDARECDVANVSELEAGTFDTVVMGGNNFGLVGTRATAPRILGGLAEVTSDEASPLAETRDVHASEDPDHLAYHELNRQRGRLPGALRIRVRFKRHTSPWFDYLMVSPEEMCDVIEPTPWCVADIIEPNELETSDQYYAILRKGRN